jgi:hypothetical protein
LKEMDKQEVFTSMEPFFDFPSAEHESSNTTNVGGTHQYKSAAAGPAFDFGNNDLLPGFEFQAGVESSRSSTQADSRARRSLSPPLVRTLFLPPPPSFSSIETFCCIAELSVLSLNPDLIDSPFRKANGGWSSRL